MLVAQDAVDFFCLPHMNSCLRCAIFFLVDKGINSPLGTWQKASWRNWFDSNCNCSKQELLSWASLRFAAALVTDLLEPQHWCTEWVEGTQHVQKEKMNTRQYYPAKVPNSLPLVPVIVDLTLVISHSFKSLEAHWIDNLLSEQQHCRQNLKHSRPWMNTWLNIFKGYKYDREHENELLLLLRKHCKTPVIHLLPSICIHEWTPTYDIRLLPTLYTWMHMYAHGYMKAYRCVCMKVCVFACCYICMACMHVGYETCRHECIRMCMHTCRHIDVHVWRYICWYVCCYIHFACMLVSYKTSICLHVCMYVWRYVCWLVCCYVYMACMLVCYAPCRHDAILTDMSKQTKIKRKKRNFKKENFQKPDHGPKRSWQCRWASKISRLNLLSSCTHRPTHIRAREHTHIHTSRWSDPAILSANTRSR